MHHRIWTVPWQIFAGFQRLLEKLSGQNETAFFFDIKFAAMSEAKERPFWTSLPPPKEFRLRNKKLNFYIAAHCHLPGRLCRYCQQKKKDIKKRESANLRRCQNCNRKWSWIRIRIFGLIRIQMSVRSVLKCGCIILSPLVSVISPSMVQIDWLYEKC